MDTQHSVQAHLYHHFYSTHLHHELPPIWQYRDLPYQYSWSPGKHMIKVGTVSMTDNGHEANVEASGGGLFYLLALESTTVLAFSIVCSSEKSPTDTQ